MKRFFLLILLVAMCGCDRGGGSFDNLSPSEAVVTYGRRFNKDHAIQARENERRARSGEAKTNRELVEAFNSTSKSAIDSFNDSLTKSLNDSVPLKRFNEVTQKMETVPPDDKIADAWGEIAEGFERMAE